MNRAARRNFARSNHNGKTFQEVFKTLMAGQDRIDTDKAVYCWRHPLKLENPAKPTEADKRKIEAIKLKPGKKTDEKGNIIFYRMCPRCFQIVYTDTKMKPTDGSSKGLDGFTQKQHGTNL